jgi:hypothetical protein
MVDRNNLKALSGNLELNSTTFSYVHPRSRTFVEQYNLTEQVLGEQLEGTVEFITDHWCVQ